MSREEEGSREEASAEEPVRSNARELLDAYRTKAGFDSLYPEGQRREALLDFVSRLEGDLPDGYDYIATGVQFEMNAVLRSKALMILKEGAKSHEFDWTKVGRHPVLRLLEDLTVSMGGGKGRREGVEMSKSNPPVPPKSR